MTKSRLQVLQILPVQRPVLQKRLKQKKYSRDMYRIWCVSLQIPSLDKLTKKKNNSYIRIRNCEHAGMCVFEHLSVSQWELSFYCVTFDPGVGTGKVEDLMKLNGIWKVKLFTILSWSQIMLMEVHAIIALVLILPNMKDYLSNAKCNTSQQLNMSKQFSFASANEVYLECWVCMPSCRSLTW